MLFTNLKLLPHEKEKKYSERIKRILELAILDPSIKLAIKTEFVESIESVWVYEKKHAINLYNAQYFAETETEKLIEAKKDIDEVDGMMDENGIKLVDSIDIKLKKATGFFLVCENETLKEILNDGEAYPYTFTSVYLTYFYKPPEEIFPDNFKENQNCLVFLLCNQEKNENELDASDIQCAPAILSGLFVFVDLEFTTYKDEILDLLPDLRRLPDYIQRTLSVLPKEFNNVPERMKYLLELYVKYWGNVSREEAKRFSDLDIENKLISIKDEISKVEHTHWQRRENSRTIQITFDFGEKLSGYAARIITPDFFIYGKKIEKLPISDGVPRTFWVLWRLSEYFWSEVDHKKFHTHPENKHIENVMRLINNKINFLGKNKNDNNEININLTEIQNAKDDYKKIIKKYPQIPFFWDVNFRSDYESAATLIRPYWAYSKNKGDILDQPRDEPEEYWMYITKSFESREND